MANQQRNWIKKVQWSDEIFKVQSKSIQDLTQINEKMDPRALFCSHPWWSTPSGMESKVLSIPGCPSSVVWSFSTDWLSGSFFSLFWLCGLFFADVRPRCAVALPEMVFSLARIAVLHQSASHTSSLAALNLSVRIFSGWAVVFLNLLSHSFFLISSRLFLPPTDKLSSPTSEDRILQVWSQMNHHVINGVTTGVGLRNRNWQIDE